MNQKLVGQLIPEEMGEVSVERAWHIINIHDMCELRGGALNLYLSRLVDMLLTQ